MAAIAFCRHLDSPFYQICERLMLMDLSQDSLSRVICTAASPSVGTTDKASVSSSFELEMKRTSAAFRLGPQRLLPRIRWCVTKPSTFLFSFQVVLFWDKNNKRRQVTQRLTTATRREEPNRESAPADCYQSGRLKSLTVCGRWSFHLASNWEWFCLQGFIRFPPRFNKVTLLNLFSLKSA